MSRFRQAVPTTTRTAADLAAYKRFRAGFRPESQERTDLFGGLRFLGAGARLIWGKSSPEWTEKTPVRRPICYGEYYSRIRSMRRGTLNSSEFGLRMQGEGVLAEQIEAMFKVACRKAGLPEDGPELSTAAFRRPEGAQLDLNL